MLEQKKVRTEKSTHKFVNIVPKTDFDHKMGLEVPNFDDLDAIRYSFFASNPNPGILEPISTEILPNPAFKTETRFLVKSLGGYTFSKPDFPKLGHQLGPPGGTLYPSGRGKTVLKTLLQIAPPGGAKPYS